VFVKVKQRKSCFKLGSYAKSASRYCGPFEILARVGPMAYHLTLPPNLRIHNLFHVSILKWYVHDATHVIGWNVIQVEPEGYFLVELDCILEKREINLRNDSIGQVKVQWKHLGPNQATWELEGKMREAYPILFRVDMEDV